MRVTRLSRASAFALALLGVVALAGSALAQDGLRLGPDVGAKIPHSLKANDHTGKARSFADLKGENGLLLVFSRSVNW